MGVSRTLISVLNSREKIYDHIQNWSICRWASSATHKQYITYCVAKDTIQDTAETILAHRARDFSSDVWDRYLEYYGVLQAAYMQQDTINALHKLFLGSNINFGTLEHWKDLRDFRNDTVGHPVSRQRFLNRNIISYEVVNYSAWPSDTQVPESENVALGSLIDGYANEASNVLETVHDNLVQSCYSGHR